MRVPPHSFVSSSSRIPSEKTKSSLMTSSYLCFLLYSSSHLFIPPFSLVSCCLSLSTHSSPLPAPSLPPTQAAAVGNKILWETGFIPSLFPAPCYFCLTISSLSGRLSLPAANQLFPRLGSGSWHNKTRDDKGEKRKRKAFQIAAAAKTGTETPQLPWDALKVSAVGLTQRNKLPYARATGTASLGSLKGTFPASNPSKSPNTSIHLSPVRTDESCINPAPNAAVSHC